MTTYCAREEATALTDEELESALGEVFEALGPRRRVVAVPPDITRHHSFAGRITELAWQHYGDRLKDVLPALGADAPSSAAELLHMFGSAPHGLFRVHRWKDDVETLGRVAADEVQGLSEGRLCFDWLPR